MTNIKTTWANRADRRNAWADAAEAKARALLDNQNHDWAFITQPGHLPARAKQIADTDRAYELLAKADAHRAKAKNLTKMANSKKGDAERARQAVRDALTLKAGDKAVSIHYGACEIVKVNTKTYRIRTESGFTTTQDKSYIRPAA
jgi:hypothetical protein